MGSTQRSKTQPSGKHGHVRTRTQWNLNDSSYCLPFDSRFNHNLSSKRFHGDNSISSDPNASFLHLPWDINRQINGFDSSVPLNISNNINNNSLSNPINVSGALNTSYLNNFTFPTMRNPVANMSSMSIDMKNFCSLSNNFNNNNNNINGMLNLPLLNSSNNIDTTSNGIVSSNINKSTNVGLQSTSSLSLNQNNQNNQSNNCNINDNNNDNINGNVIKNNIELNELICFKCKKNKFVDDINENKEFIDERKKYYIKWYCEACKEEFADKNNRELLDVMQCKHSSCIIKLFGIEKFLQHVMSGHIRNNQIDYNIRQIFHVHKCCFYNCKEFTTYEFDFCEKRHAEYNFDNEMIHDYIYNWCEDNKNNKFNIDDFDNFKCVGCNKLYREINRDININVKLLFRIYARYICDDCKIKLKYNKIFKCPFNDCNHRFGIKLNYIPIFDKYDELRYHIICNHKSFTLYNEFRNLLGITDCNFDNCKNDTINGFCKDHMNHKSMNINNHQNNNINSDNSKNSKIQNQNIKKDQIVNLQNNSIKINEKIVKNTDYEMTEMKTQRTDHQNGINLNNDHDHEFNQNMEFKEDINIISTIVDDLGKIRYQCNHCREYKLINHDIWQNDKFKYYISKFYCLDCHSKTNLYSAFYCNKLKCMKNGYYKKFTKGGSFKAWVNHQYHVHNDDEEILEVLGKKMCEFNGCSCYIPKDKIYCIIHSQNYDEDIDILEYELKLDNNTYKCKDGSIIDLR